ncbi:arginine deiminase-related protein [Aliiglaciecola sp. CAU 1673]|uniref:citrulline utilization hydrolase CtlX n=1 Tax=Aliiglaciecola sp. CAU 1673 TaxID=3032595 RepID=UPI0023D9B85D|nr:arginine deiminase-related protein [Aliiglaciecola sp. CAU 1673]MDF2177632.1 arginine deiminase-related protein [Aliiglaciecola sp. CAU 1673]
MTAAQQTTSTLLMVPPVHFAFNEQTGEDNSFQQHLDLKTQEIRTLAMAEFDAMVEKLCALGVNILTLPVEKDGPKTPDAVFPNNWFSTHDDGELVLYPMAVENRRMEVQPQRLRQCLTGAGFNIQSVWDCRDNAQDEHYLEGTGAMVLDRVNGIVYAALSQRCHADVLETFCAHRNLRAEAFDTRMQNSQSVYHTNVMMAVGKHFAIICTDVIVPGDQKRVKKAISATHQIIEISEAQLHAFCGNVLEVQNDKGEALILMSSSAFAAFSDEQKAQLEQFGQLVPLDIPTIETIGGGSVRCMLAEIFLPQNLTKP